MTKPPAPTLLLTRPAEGAARFSADLRAGLPGLRQVMSPLQEVASLPWHIAGPAPDAVIFTSANALGPAHRAGLSGRAFCVGRATTAAARALGFDAVFAGQDAEALVACLAARPALRLWHLRGRVSRGKVAARLAAAGHQVAEALAYDTRPLPLTDEAAQLLRGSDPVLWPLFSPEGARAALSVLPRHRAGVTALCLSPAVAEVLPENLPRRIAARPDAASMIEIVADALNSAHPA